MKIEEIDSDYIKVFWRFEQNSQTLASVLWGGEDF